MRYTILIASIALAGSLNGVSAQTGLRPAPSGRGTSEVSLAVPRPQGSTTPAPPPILIRLDYGQPHLRGRVLHTDSLVPYDKPWRLGANANTMLTTDVDLVVGGATVPKGKYVLYTIPARSGWKLVIQRDNGQTAAGYKDSDDVARIDLRHATLTTPMEALTMWLIPSTAPGLARGELRFAWGTDQLSTDWSVR